MQKKIIALAIASAMTMPAMAIAAPTVYGQANMGFAMTDTGGTGGTGTAASKRNQVISDSSFIGVKGSEDLGDGLTAVYQMEGEVEMDTGATALFTNNTFLGLAGNFGTVVLGNHDTPYRMSTRGYDVFGDGIADNQSIMGAKVLDYHASDVLAYITPDFSGFTGVVAMVGENDNTLGATLTTIGFPVAAAYSAVSASGNYARDNFTVALGYIGINAKNTVDITGTKLGGSYAMDDFAVNAVYEMINMKPNVGNKTDQANLYLSGTMKVSDAGMVKLAYTMGFESKTGSTKNKDSASQISLGYDHAMTKNTTVYALYTSISNDKNSTNMAYTLSGSNFAGTTTGALGGANAANNPTAIAVGVRHSF